MSTSNRSTKVFSVSLPFQVLDQLDIVTSEMGLSRSAFLTAYLGHTLPSFITALNIQRSLLDDRGVPRRYSSLQSDELDQLMAKLLKTARDLEDQHGLF